MSEARLKTVWILRHGEAANTAPDPARALTRTGREEVLRSAAHLMAEPLQKILASPYTRAQETARLVQTALGQSVALQTVDWLTPDSDPDRVVAELDRLGLDQVLLVSHQPLVGMLLGLLDRGERASVHAMGTASLARLEGPALLAGLMTLRSLRHSH
ncbi:phosphohistidine phosphatase SixA [Pseudomonas japonica]|uniref:phosphohistidine phosphatase SixA n=1 Tax=Pseudomonas japonica TaxID=256466 RepID=UPI00280C3214|nr:phosphohistidine phosphatase SixA [Pseudomonas japonica]